MFFSVNKVELLINGISLKYFNLDFKKEDPDLDLDLTKTIAILNE